MRQRRKYVIYRNLYPNKIANTMAAEFTIINGIRRRVRMLPKKLQIRSRTTLDSCPKIKLSTKKNGFLLKLICSTDMEDVVESPSGERTRFSDKIAKALMISSIDLSILLR